MAVQVSYPGSQPSGSVQHSSNVNTTYTATGNAWVDNDQVTFGFEFALYGAVTCRVDVSDDELHTALANGQVSWALGDTGWKYIKFSSFPLQGGRSTDSCDYVVTLTNDEGSSGTHVAMKIWRS